MLLCNLCMNFQFPAQNLRIKYQHSYEFAFSTSCPSFWHPLHTCTLWHFQILISYAELEHCVPASWFKENQWTYSQHSAHINIFPTFDVCQSKVWGQILHINILSRFCPYQHIPHIFPTLNGCLRPDSSHQHSLNILPISTYSPHIPHPWWVPI